jgi:NADH dehydrogenase [ubiquinone] 1 alpha subcomplex assembly factor 6
LVRHHDRDRFQTALFAPAARREALFALYAFNYEIARVRESVTQPSLGQIRLEWWRENVASAFDGGPARRHPVVEALTAAIRERGLTRSHFDRLIDAREADFDDDPPATLAVLEDYAEATSSSVILLALEALGVREPAAAEAGRHIGIAYSLAGLLRAMSFHAGTRRPVIPADLAARAGLDPGDRPERPGNRAVRAAAAEIATSAAGHLREARGRRGAVPRAALPALLPAVVAGTWVKRLKRAGHDPFARALARPDPLQSWRLAAAALFNRF